MDPLAVGDLARRIRDVLAEAEDLTDVWVRGEVTDLKRAASGHLYFALKDADGVVACVAWATAARRMPFRPVDGLAVLARGDVRFWVDGGRLQFYVTEMREAGQGDATAALEALRRRLQAEGLFDEDRKRPLPPFPRVVGMVTSLQGAVVRDVANVLGRRAPAVRLLVRSVRVQGEDAPAEIAAAIAHVGALPEGRRPDVLIVGRGGGSAEDLSAFQAERVVRAICASPIPVVSAVGHESDVTLADFAADVRAATPSAAAEIVTADLVEADGALASYAERMGAALRLRVARSRERLEGLSVRGPLAAPDLFLAGKRQRADEAAAVLNSLSPLATLGRGYAVLRRADGSVLLRAVAAREGEDVTLTLADGDLDARVTRVRAAGKPATTQETLR